MKIIINEFISDTALNPFEKWFDKLNARAAAKVATALYRMENGNFSNVKNLKGGVFEYKIDFGPGYRIYFGQEGDRLIILLGGGTKKQQSKDIKMAKGYWQQYKKSIKGR